jgi:uncharacterized protein (TIGR02145 family)
MKTLLLIAVIFLYAIHSSMAQTNIINPKKIYRTWIETLQGYNKIKGALFEIKDSSLMVSNSFDKRDYYRGNYNVSKVDVQMMDVVKIRRVGSGNRATVIGTISGFAAGVLIGSLVTRGSGGGSFNPGGTMLFAAWCTGLGAIIGAVAGSVKIKIPIDGSQKKFDRYKSKMNEYAMKYNPYIKGISPFSFLKLRDTVEDIDGNIYQLVTIDGQVWLADNLRVTRFRNGKEIPFVKDSSAWASVPSAACCNYRNDTNNVAAFGRLYNWETIRDTSGLCPVGWHIPTFTEWTSLINLLEGYDNAGGYMKETGTAHWSSPNITLYNNNTFALPGGSRNRNGAFSEPGRTCQWWVTNGNDTENIQGLSLSNESTRIKMINPDKKSGLSVRCIRDGK